MANVLENENHNLYPPSPHSREAKGGGRGNQKKSRREAVLRSVKYCQRCGREVYPDSEGRYPLFEIIDKKWEIPLLVCEECYKKEGGE